MSFIPIFHVLVPISPWAYCPIAAAVTSVGRSESLNASEKMELLFLTLSQFMEGLLQYELYLWDLALISKEAPTIGYI